MRIGILTFHKAINYGAFLQAFSLSEMLQAQHPNGTVEIIDYINSAKRNNLVLLWSLKHRGIKGAWIELVKNRRFASVQKNLRLSPKSFKSHDTAGVLDYIKNRYDRLVIGSDAVFNWKQNGFPTVYPYWP